MTPKKKKSFICLADGKGFETAEEFSNHVHSSGCSDPVWWPPSADWLAANPGFKIGFPKE
jgi:hypothetical protein